MLIGVPTGIKVFVRHLTEVTIGCIVALDYHIVRASSELGSIERVLLNIASLLEAESEVNTYLMKLLDAAPMDSVNLLLPSLDGDCLECNGAFALLVLF